MPKICIAGKNNIAVNALAYLVNILNINKDNICVVVNKTDDGVDAWQKSLKHFAENNNIAVCSLQDTYEIEELIFISLEFDKIINTSLFKNAKLYNIHFSKLPSYKGVYTSIMPILKGETETAVTLHKMDNGIDTGNIIAQRVFKIDLQNTARDLYLNFINNAFELFKEKINDILSGNVTSYKQSNIKSSYYSRQAIDIKNYKIDFNKTSFEIHNSIRALIFKEYQLPIINGIEIESSFLTDEFIGFNKFYEDKNKFFISGIDGYKVIAKKRNINDKC